MINHRLLIISMLIVGIGFLGCEKTYAYSENCNFLKDMVTALEHSGKAIIYIDQPDLEADRFKNQLDELDEAIALMAKYDSTEIREIFDAKEAIKGSLMLIKEGNEKILEKYNFTEKSYSSESLSKFEDVIKKESKSISSGWQTLQMSMLHASHVILKHNKKYESDRDPLPFNVSPVERKLLSNRFDEALKQFEKLEERSGEKSHKIIVGLKEYARNLQMLLTAETYADIKVIQAGGI